MKKCKYCQSEIEDKVKVCPQCNKDLRNWFVKHPIWSIIIGLMIIGSIGSYGNKTTVNQTGAVKETTNTVTVSDTAKEPNVEETKLQIVEEPKKPDLELLEDSTEASEYSRSVVGKIKNNSDKTYNYAQVEINLYDNNGDLVNSTIDNINNLEPGATWKFKAMILDDDVKTYKIKDISGF